MCLTKERASTLVWDLLASALCNCLGCSCTTKSISYSSKSAGCWQQPLSGELTKLSFNWPLKILWLMILVSFLLVPWFALMKATHSHNLLFVPHLLCVRIEPLFSGCSAAGAQGPHGRRAPRTRQPARAGSAWSGNRAPGDASRYVSSGGGRRRSARRPRRTGGGGGREG